MCLINMNSLIIDLAHANLLKYALPCISMLCIFRTFFLIAFWIIEMEYSFDDWLCSDIFENVHSFEIYEKKFWGNNLVIWPYMSVDSVHGFAYCLIVNSLIVDQLITLQIWNMIIGGLESDTLQFYQQHLFLVLN